MTAGERPSAHSHAAVHGCPVQCATWLGLAWGRHQVRCDAVRVTSRGCLPLGGEGAPGPAPSSPTDVQRLTQPPTCLLARALWRPFWAQLLHLALLVYLLPGAAGGAVLLAGA